MVGRSLGIQIDFLHFHSEQANENIRAELQAKVEAMSQVQEALSASQQQLADSQNLVEDLHKEVALAKENIGALESQLAELNQVCVHPRD